MNQENELTKIKQYIGNEEKITKEKQDKEKKYNDEIENINNENISIFSKNIRINSEGQMKIIKELQHLNYLERNYGFLTTIGLKLLLKSNPNEIEGFIRAPDNSPYKNGIFNFIIKLEADYPCKNPEMKFKTKIFHTFVNDNYNGHCCMKLLNCWKKETDLSLILVCLYEFFFENNRCGYSNEASKVYNSKNFELFEKKCREYVSIYASRKFDDKLEYLFEDYYHNKKEFCGSSYLFYDIVNHKEKRLDINGIIKLETLENMLGCKINNSKIVLITGNKIYHSLNKIINCEELLENHIMFIAPCSDLFNLDKEE